MARLRKLWITHTTADVADAGTDDKVFLHLPRGGKVDDVVGHVIKFPDPPHDERERNRTDEYEIDVSMLRVDESDLLPLNSGSIQISIDGSDAWLPKTLRVVGETETGKRVLLVHIPRWPSNRKFSDGSNEGRGIWRLQE